MKLARWGVFAPLINAIVNHSSALTGTTVVPNGTTVLNYCVNLVLGINYNESSFPILFFLKII